MLWSKKYPTDLELLEYIHDLYFDEFCRYDLNPKKRGGKIHVPIDCHKVATHFGTNGDIIFGRLYYDLAKKYSYKTDEKQTFNVFDFKIGDDLHCVNFPYLNSVVSGLKSKQRRENLTINISVIALIISLCSFLTSAWDKL